MSSETQGPPRRTLRNLALLGSATLLLLLGATIWLLGTASGARTALALATDAAGASLELGQVEGRLAGPLRLQRLALQRDGMQLELTDIRLDWVPQALLRGRLHIRSLRIGEFRMTRPISKDDQPAVLPDSLALPFKLQVDAAQVERGSINWGPLTVIRLGGFNVHLDYDGARYRLGLDQLTADASSAAGAFNGSVQGQAQLASNKPYALTASFASQAQALVRQQQFDATGKFAIEGSLAEMMTTLEIAAGDARVKGQAMLRPFSALPLGSAALDVQALDLAAFQSSLPQTRISGKLTASETGGTLLLANADAGPLNTARLPLRSLLVKFRQEARKFTFDQIDAALGTAAAPAGTLSGSGTLLNGALQLTLATDALNLQRLDARLLATRLAGRFDVRHAEGKQAFTLTASEPLRQNRLTLSAQATLADAALALEYAELKLGKAQLRAAGHIALAGDQRFKVEGQVSRFRLQDLGQFAQVPNLYLNGDFSLAGVRMPQLAADLRFKITDSRLGVHALHGEGSARLSPGSLDIPKLLLAAGDNQLKLAGKLAGSGGQLSFALAAPRLAQLGPGFGGALQASGSVRGSFERPRINAQWQASQVSAPGAVQIGSMQGSADLTLDHQAPLWLNGARIELAARALQAGALRLASMTGSLRFAPQPNAPLALQLQVQDIVAANLKADSFSVNASGTTAQHTLAASLLEPSQQWRLHATGALQGLGLAQAPRWQGSIDRLDGSGRFAATLAAPAPLLVSQQRVQLTRFRLNAERTTIAIEQLLRDARGIVTRGHFEHLQVAALLPFLQPQALAKTDLQLGGQWDVALTDAPRGTLTVRRESGDVQMLGNTPVALGLRQLEARANLANGRLAVQFIAAGAQLGDIHLNAGVAINGSRGRIGIAPQAPVSGNAQVSIASLRWLGPLVMPSAITDGSLQGDMALSGSFSQPRFSGNVHGKALRLALPELGVNLQQGTLDSSFQDTRLVIRQLAFQQPGGSLTIAGPIDLSNAQPTAQLSLKAERYGLLDRSDRQLVVSGDGKISLSEGRLQVSGALAVNAGMVDIGRADKPQLSDDVVIVGRQQGKAGMPMALDLTIALGDGINIRGRGIKALVRGELKLISEAGRAIQGQGTLRIAKGTYAAYGRELAIETGLLRFNGPLANPALNILAMRRGQEVEAGVAVRGTVLAPRVTLVSEPGVPDAEKLSWLVLGRGLDAATGGGDLAMLQNAAGMLLTEGAAAGVEAGLASAFGLDELSIGTSGDSLQQRIITFGKQVSARLYVSIEQGLETASSVLQLRYTVSRRLSLEVDTGTRTAFTLFYNFTFD